MYTRYLLMLYKLRCTAESNFCVHLLMNVEYSILIEEGTGKAREQSSDMEIRHEQNTSNSLHKPATHSHNSQ